MNHDCSPASQRVRGALKRQQARRGADRAVPRVNRSKLVFKDAREKRPRRSVSAGLPHHIQTLGNRQERLVGRGGLLRGLMAGFCQERPRFGMDGRKTALRTVHISHKAKIRWMVGGLAGREAKKKKEESSRFWHAAMVCQPRLDVVEGLSGAGQLRPMAQPGQKAFAGWPRPEPGARGAWALSGVKWGQALSSIELCDRTLHTVPMAISRDDGFTTPTNAWECAEKGIKIKSVEKEAGNGKMDGSVTTPPPMQGAAREQQDTESRTQEHGNLHSIESPTPGMYQPPQEPQMCRATAAGDGVCAKYVCTTPGPVQMQLAQ